MDEGAGHLLALFGLACLLNSLRSREKCIIRKGIAETYLGGKASLLSRYISGATCG